ncbi:hypothetical protein [Amycolatopsis sp. NPDC059021]|uniref:TolB family protein n=1 Tax=Amycolatopsis sp. NPDC059021 TaxID=3346704 RepID=UPI00366E394C
MTRRTTALAWCAALLLATAAPAHAAPSATRPDGAELLYRPAGPASAQNAAFSPDGATVVFTQFPRGYNAGPAALELLGFAPGGTPRQLFQEGDQSAVNLPGTSWNAAAGLITFSFDGTDLDEIWTIRPDGGGRKQVTTHTGPRGFTEPSFSPDGQWIVFQENLDQSGPGALGSIWKVRRDGSGLTRLIDGPGTGTDNRQPNWSPRGDRIVFQARGATGAWKLRTISPDGGSSRAVTSGAGEDTDASWSPDGSRIVFSSDRGGLAHAQLFVIPADGGPAVQVTHAPTWYSGAPSWSPDGRWLAFESREGDGGTPTALWRIAAPA